ncbi:hypothetical protein AB0M02_45475 [Actinoplanes sp. NPDC051861]|uniref:hypothetical protein n=1 Tax=Actinoplanes sp. NPDC051861 TaxID=3155170 RepID=UPI003446FCA6
MLTRRSVVPAALLLALVAGCANSNDIDAGAPAPAPESASPGPTAELPTASAPAGPTTITGTVRQGVEPGCLLLKDGSGDYLLIFKDDAMEKSVKVGSEITATGKTESGMMTTCMQGSPFVVSSVGAG